MATNYNTQADTENFALVYAKMEEIRLLTAAMGQDIVDYTDVELAAIKAQIALLDQDGVTASLAKIQAFIDAVDSDGDNVIDQMATLVSSITAAATKAQAALDKATSVETGLSSVVTTQQGLQTQVDSVKGTVDGHTTRIEALEAREDNAGLTEAQVRAIAVEQDRVLVQAFVDAAPDFAAIVLNKAYPITGDDESTDTGAVESI